MKKQTKWLLILSIIMLTSCNNWLDMETIGSKTTENYIKDYESAVNAYNGVHQTFLNLYSGDYQVMLDIITDDAFTPSHVDAPAIKTFDKLQISEGSGAEYYSTLYTGITRINTALDEIAKLEEHKDYEQIKMVKGQLLFMRGFFYFTLVKLYGEVPILPLVKNINDTKQPRASFEKLYELIEQDIKEAAGLMPDALTNKKGLEYGKPYKYVAYACLSDFYIYFEKWFEADQYLDLIIGSDKFDKADYLTVFNQEDDVLGVTYSTAYNKEVIWDAYYDIAGKQVFTWRYTPMGRHDNRSGYGLSVIYCTQNDLDIHNDEGGITPYRGKDGGLGIIDEFEDGDRRLAELFWVDDVVTPNVSGYWGVIKYDGKSYATQSTLNYPVYRYAEILLMKAEVENELGDIGAAKNIINNDIRSAADLEPISPQTKEQMREAIFKERRLELAFEAKRFFDLNRRGLATEYLEDKQVSVSKGGLSTHEITNPITGKKNFVFSLPKAEINANPYIEQNNPGY